MCVSSKLSYHTPHLKVQGGVPTGSCGQVGSPLYLYHPHTGASSLSFNGHGRGDTSNVSSEQVANAMRQCIAVSVQVRCKTGPILNNGRQMLVLDYVYGRFYNITDNFGRMRPGAQLQG